MEYRSDLSFSFVQKTRIVFGAGSVAELGGIVAELGLRRALVVTDNVLAEKTDFLTRVKKALGPLLAGIFCGVIPDPTAEVVDLGTEYARSVGADVLVTIGGGSVIDTGKGMAVTLREGGKILEHEGYHALSRPQTPHIAIPTTAGTGSEMTLVTVITDPARRQKTFIGSYHLLPAAAILDPTLITGLPSRLTAATGMDAMSHAVEALISSSHQPLSDACALEAIRLITRFLPRSLERPNDIAVRGQMLIAANLAGSALSNAMASLNHAMAHSLGARFHVHHGLLNAILLPHTMRFFQNLCADRFEAVANAMGVNVSGKSPAAAERMEEFVKGLGLTDRLRDFGVGEGDLEEIADLAMSDAAIVYSPRPIEDPTEVLRILRAAW